MPLYETNDFLVGEFKDLNSSETVSIGKDSISLCDGALQANYATDSVNSFKVIVSSVVNRNCVNKNSTNLLQVVSRATFYRMENPNILTFYDNNKVVARLQFCRKYIPSTPSNTDTNTPESTVPGQTSSVSPSS